MKKEYDTVIKISSDRAEIAVEQNAGGVTIRKNLTPETLAKCFVGSLFDEQEHFTGFLPEHCFASAHKKGTTLYFMRCPILRADISYYGTEYPDFPLPRLVFSVLYLRETGKVGSVRLAVVKDEKLTPDTPLYRYPFSNVYSNYSVCLGNNALPIYKNPARLGTLMEYILRLPNNNDMFQEENNRLGLGYRELLDHLKDKEPAYYYTDVLLPSDKTLSDFMDRR